MSWEIPLIVALLVINLIITLYILYKIRKLEEKRKKDKEIIKSIYLKSGDLNVEVEKEDYIGYLRKKDGRRGAKKREQEVETLYSGLMNEEYKISKLLGNFNS